MARNLDEIIDECAVLETPTVEKNGSPQRGYHIAKELFEMQHRTRAGVFDMANVRHGVVHLDTSELSEEDRDDVYAYLRQAQ